jgi:TolB-like protein/DNA-binding SARP family transcriptional activator/Tfp pilus assembly protein PilF
MATPADTIVRMNAPARLWRLDCRGSFALWDGDGRLVTIRGRKARAILAYLVTYSHEHVTRERLVQLLWPDRGMAQARGSLRQCLVEIRRAAPGVIVSDHEHVWIDTTRLGPVEIADSCSPTEQLFDDLDGITPELDDWLRCERATEASEQWSRLQQSVEDRLKRGRGASALPLIERMQRIDPYNEEWLRLAMRADAQAGHSAGIQTRFRELDELLKRELGVPLSPQTRELHDELLRDLAKPTAGVDIEVEETIEARTQNQPPKTPAIPRWAFRLPSLVAAGLAALVATFGLTQSVRPASVEPSRIAVLPFRALDGVDPALAEGMADQLLSDLSQHHGLQTVGRTSSWMFKDKAEDLRRVGDKLDVQYVVEGSVRRTGSALRLNVALVDTRDASTLWSRDFHSPAGDLQRMEDAAAAGIVERLGLRTENKDQHADPQAYARYVRAKALIRDRNWAKMREARELLQQAVKIDPDFAPAWAQLGGVLMFVGDRTPLSGGNLKSMNAKALAAARRAVALDPQLAEAHQMLGFALGFETPEGRAHLRHALQLDPRNPQTVYWWSNAAAMAGNAPLQERAARRALALDPLWKRPAEIVSKFAIHNGRRTEAYRLLDKLRAADPEAALEVEMALLREEGDHSNVVKIGRAQGNITTVQGTAGKMTLAWSLIEMGYVREALLISGVSPFDRLVYLRRVPDRRNILAKTDELIGTSEESWVLTPLLLELARTNRHEEIVALFDRRGSAINRLQRIDDSNRIFRATLGPIIGRALLKVGRNREGVRLFHASDEATRVILANGNLSPQATAELAGGEAMLGRRDRALILLGRAVSGGWFAYDGLSYRLNEMPWFESLRGNPKFEQLVRTTDARRLKERRETEALGLI